MTEILIRHAGPDDQNYVIATWLHHFKSNSYFAKRIRHAVYYDRQHRVISTILSRTRTQVLIAHPEGEPEVILGFLVSEDLTTYHSIHFAFVKEELRRMGIAKKLVTHAGIDPDGAHFTHWTYPVNDLINRFPGLIYDPYPI